MDTCADVYVYVYVTDSHLYRFREAVQNQRFDGMVVPFSFVCTSVLPMRTCCALYILERFYTLWDFCLQCYRIRVTRHVGGRQLLLQTFVACCVLHVNGGRSREGSLVVSKVACVNGG